ncbi:CAP domain-containing protein [Streptomyces griseoincarnatus]
MPVHTPALESLLDRFVRSTKFWYWLHYVYPYSQLQSEGPAVEREFWALINDARLHPEKYPPLEEPKNNALMAPCRKELDYSGALRDTARTHSSFLQKQPKEWVTKGNNMHASSVITGVPLVYQEDGTLHQAGYKTFRSENVAVGQATPEDAVRFWMQRDAAHNWGHRNAILRCETRDGGVGYVAGGDWNHYWTLDLGTR